MHIFFSVTKPRLLIVIVSDSYYSYVSFSYAEYGLESMEKFCCGSFLISRYLCVVIVYISEVVYISSCNLRDLIGHKFPPRPYNIFIINLILCFGIFCPIGHHPCVVSSFTSKDRVASFGFSCWRLFLCDLTFIQHYVYFWVLFCCYFSILLILLLNVLGKNNNSRPLKLPKKANIFKLNFLNHPKESDYVTDKIPAKNFMVYGKL